jgi:hypothetical protein
VTTPEQRLPGGNLHGAVRVGDTVRKPAGPWTPAIHALLRHLEGAGFREAPRSLGVDEQGRHITTYLPGETVGDQEPWPAWVWRDEALAECAHWLRRYHDVVASFDPPEDAVWRLSSAAERGSTVCHNDLAPYNVVWDDGIVGVIDWDLASPNDPRWDVAQACVGFSPLLPRDLALRDGADPSVAFDRCRRFLDAYGVEDRVMYAGLVLERYEMSVRRIRHEATTDAVFARLLADKQPFFERVLAYLDDIEDELAAALA